MCGLRVSSSSKHHGRLISAQCTSKPLLLTLLPFFACHWRGAPEDLPLVPDFFVISCKTAICNSEHNWNNLPWDPGESVQHILLPAASRPLLHASPPADLCLLSAMHSFHVNHLNPHATVTAEGFAQWVPWLLSPKSLWG